MPDSGFPFLSLIGGAGAGLVWGWLVGLLIGRVRRRLLTPCLVLLASIPLGVEVWWFLGLSPLAWAVGAGVLAFSLHAAWRIQLRRQVQALIPGTGGQP